MRVVTQCTRLTRDAVKSAALELLRAQLDKSLRCLNYVGHALSRGWDQMSSKDLPDTLESMVL